MGRLGFNTRRSEEVKDERRTTSGLVWRWCCGKFTEKKWGT